MKNIGVAIGARGAAIVTVDQSADDLFVTGIEILPRDIDAVAERVDELETSEPRDSLFIIDSEGSGSALWELFDAAPSHMFVLTDEEIAKRKRWRLYDKHSFERQELVNALLVATSKYAGSLHFAAHLENQEALFTALTSYTQRVGVDGLVGDPLVVAMALAVLPRPRTGRSWSAALL